MKIKLILRELLTFIGKKRYFNKKESELQNVYKLEVHCFYHKGQNTLMFCFKYLNHKSILNRKIINTN